MFPRFEAVQAAMLDLGKSGSKPGYTAPVCVVTLVIRPCAETRGAAIRRGRVEYRMLRCRCAMFPKPECEPDELHNFRSFDLSHRSRSYT